MSKAFTKETEAEEELPEFVDSLPPGMKNYMTPEGAERLRDELCHLRDVERPKLVESMAVAAGEREKGKRRLRGIDRRMDFIAKRLQITEVVDHPRCEHPSLPPVYLLHGLDNTHRVVDALAHRNQGADVLRET